MLKLSKAEETLVQHQQSLNVAWRIMQIAERPQGATVEELLDQLRVPAGTLHPRLYELLHSGCLRVDGKRETRTRRLARVYKLTKGTTLQQYIELRGITFSKRPTDKLTNVERTVLAAGMFALSGWCKGEKWRRGALTRS